MLGPVQTGKSVLGEIMLCRWISDASGSIQYNWENNDKAEERWTLRVSSILRATRPVFELWPTDRSKAGKCLVAFPGGPLKMQGVFDEENLDSASVRYQINEEIHGWEPGRLSRARERLTAFWNSTELDISNAGKVSGQLHRAWLESQQRHWEVKCPGCGQYHRMRARWEDRHPEFGGLRYDASAARGEDGYDYNKIAPTVRYQFPCGHAVPDEVSVRRALSLSGRYGKPENTGAPAAMPGFTMQAVACDWVPWIKLIQEKHSALAARKNGDSEPWYRYITSRECQFHDEDELPGFGSIVVSPGIVKDREGLANRLARFAALDRQQGSVMKGELPHWWIVIRDVDDTGNSLLLFEGKALTDEDAASVIERHQVPAVSVVVDSGDDTTHVYQFCLRYGYNAIKGSGAKEQQIFRHADGSQKIYSPDKPLHAMLNAPPRYPYTLTTEGEIPDPREPRFWLYSKPGIRERLAWIRVNRQFVVPSDVSQDYLDHMESEELETYRHPITHETLRRWVQVRKRNDLFVCECYIAMLIDMGGLIADRSPIEERQ